MNTLLTLHDPAAAERYYRQGVWRSDTFYSLLAGHAARRPAAPALRGARQRLSYAQTLRRVDALAEDLRRCGVRRGQRVSIWLADCVDCVIVLLACSRNGYVCNPSLHQNYRTEDIVGLLARLETAALFTRHDASAIETLAFLKKIYRDLPESGTPGNTADTVADDNPDKVVYLAFTSGTTGEPKGVMHSDNTLLANARAMVKDWRHDENTVLFSLSPLSHHIAWVGVAQALIAGMELVVNDPPEGQTALDWIVASGATYVMGVPTHAIDILAEMRKRSLERLGQVGVFYMAGSPIPPAVARAFLDLGITPQNVYGMTENSSHQYTLPEDEMETIVNTCGRACKGYEVSLWKQTDRDAPAEPGEIGEIGGRGGCLMLGYFDNQSATEKSFNAHGWFMSGDLGRLDDRGCLHIMGRAKDLIIRGGHNIHPSEIEALALRHPAVNKAAAIPVPDPRLGERVCLAIIAENSEPEPYDLLNHLHREGLAKHDMPEYYLALEHFPLTASGKILKRELAERVRRGELAPLAVRWQGA